MSYSYGEGIDARARLEDICFEIEGMASATDEERDTLNQRIFTRCSALVEELRPKPEGMDAVFADIKAQRGADGSKPFEIINEIKHIRARTGLGLKESKDLWDKARAEGKL